MYAKIFAQIFDSSIAENYQTRHVFEDFLKLADPNGVVDMTHEAISRRTNVPIEIVRSAILELEKPDARSRTPDHSGCRIVRMDEHRDWGWIIINYKHFRELATEEQRREKTLKRVHRFRLKAKGLRKPKCNASVTLANAGNAMQKKKKKYKEKDTIPGVQGALDISVQANEIVELAKHGFFDLHGNEVPESLRTPEFMVVLEEWHAYKKEKKDTYKPIGAKNFMREMAGLGKVDFVINCIRYSMGQNWSGVHAPRELSSQSQSAVKATTPIFIQIRNIEEAISRHPANPDSTFHRQDCTLEQKDDLREKRRKITELKAKQ